MLPSWVQNGKALYRPGKGRLNILAAVAGLALLALVFWKVPLLPSPQFAHNTWVVSPSVFPHLPAREVPQESTDPLLPPAADIFPQPLRPRRRHVVPKVVHYVYGLKPVPAGHKPDELPYYAYLAMRSALINIQPDKIYFYYQNLPTGPWWDAIAPHLTLIKTETVDEVYGNKVSKFAHKADIVRLWAIQHSGGIYLDIDMFMCVEGYSPADPSIKSFDDLLAEPMTMGMEASPDSRRTALEPEGLCNAVIIAQPNATFLDHWMRTYATFDENNWAGHSVQMPWKLARRYPDEIQVLNTTAFFWPLWSGDYIERLHERDEYDFVGTGQYAYHAWESLAMKYLHVLSPSSIKTVDTSFHRLVRPFVSFADEEIYAKWKKQHRP